MSNPIDKQKFNFVWCMADNVQDICSGKIKPWIENQFDAAADEVVFSAALILKLHDVQANRLEDILAIAVAGSTDDLIKFRTEKILQDPVLGPLYSDEMRILHEDYNAIAEICNQSIFATVTKKHLLSLAAREAVERIEVYEIPNRHHPLDELASNLWLISLFGGDI
jgi:hypothetical protein